MITYFCSNSSIEIIYSKTLICSLYLEHCAYWEFLPSILKQRNSFTDGGSFNDVFGVEKYVGVELGGV